MEYTQKEYDKLVCSKCGRKAGHQWNPKFYTADFGEYLCEDCFNVDIKIIKPKLSERILKWLKITK